MSTHDAIVVGGGLVGTAIAYGLVKQGLSTLLLDEGDVAHRASRGNFGLVWVQSKGLGAPHYQRWTRGSAEEWPALAQELAERTGLDTTPYELRYQSLMARPLLLIAMVLVAASVSLRFFRFGGVTKLVIGGVAAGFVLYVATQLSEELGSSGIVNPIVAAWLPAALGAMLGALALLHQEDG